MPKELRKAMCGKMKASWYEKGGMEEWRREIEGLVKERRSLGIGMDIGEVGVRKKEDRTAEEAWNQDGGGGHREWQNVVFELNRLRQYLA